MIRTVAASTAVVVALLAAGCGGSSQASPVHVANVFADGENHGDFRQTCSVIDAKIVRKLWGSQAKCAAYFTVAFSQAVYSGAWGGYKVVPHSEKINGAKATVKMRWPGGVDTISLVKNRHGWQVESVA